MSYNINGKALEELRASTKENPSETFPKEKVPNLWDHIKEHCLTGDNNQTDFCFERLGEVYEVDIIGHLLTIYKHNWKPQSF